MSATVVAKGDSALGVWPHWVVRVDGAIVDGAFVTSDDWAPYIFDFDASARAQDVRIEFDDDHYDPPEHDRNLYVDRVTIACAPTCNDDLTNGTETDTDCGGGECPTGL